MSSPDWHNVADPVAHPDCVHCQDGDRGHYTCDEYDACMDCADDALYAAENVAAGWGPHGEEPHG